MALIHNMIPPYRDELMYSYLSRLARHNLIGSVAKFCNYFLREDHRKDADSYAGYDSSYVFNSFFHSTEGKLDKIKFFMEHSLYPYESPFVGRYKQFHLLNLYFDDRVQFSPSVFTKLTNLVKRPKVCLECRREEMEEHGEYYLHRSHNLPGVRYCHKHLTPLYEYDGKRGMEVFSSKRVFRPIRDGHEESVFANKATDIRFAVFMHELLEANLVCDINGLCTAIKIKLADMDCHARSVDNNFEVLARDMLEKGIYSVFAPKDTVADCLEETVKFLQRKLVSPRYIDSSQVASFLMYLFGTVEGLKEYLPEEDISEELRFLDTAQKEGYEVYEPYSPSLAMMRHVDCGTVFFTTPTAFMLGWKCPQCEECNNAHDKMAEVVSKTGDGLYRLVTEFRSMNQRVEIAHYKCGKVTEITPRGFLEEGVRCVCENMVWEDDVRHEIEKNGEFELVEFRDITLPLLIRHKKCGQTFYSTYHKFRDRPWCKVCNPAVRTDGYFRKEVADFVGDEYEVVGKYVDKDTPVAIRHKTCGETNEYLPRHFLDGIRCPYCKKLITDKEFASFVAHVSYGRYIVRNRLTANLYCISDMFTGQVIPMTKYKALQELTRPTPSKVLPLERRRDTKGIKTKHEADFEKLFSAYGNNLDAIVFMEDVAELFGGKTYPQVKACVQTLIRQKKLFRYATGIFVFREGLELDADRLIRETYVMRNGKRIGMPYGKSLAYEWGIIDEKPDTLFLMTKQESQEHGRAKTLYGRKVRIKGCRYPITEHNYVLIGVLDILQMSFHFGWDWKRLRKVVNDNNIMQHQFLPYLNGCNERTRKYLEELYR